MRLASHVTFLSTEGRTTIAERESRVNVANRPYAQQAAEKMAEGSTKTAHNWPTVIAAKERVKELLR